MFPHQILLLSLTFVTIELVTSGSACTLEWDPVCADDWDGNQETFSNPCVLRSYQSSEPERGWLLLHKGECKKPCRKWCPYIYAPVCGRNKYGEYKTFPNSCVFDSPACENPNEKWEILYKGECEELKPPCRRGCPKIYAPVCGQNKYGEYKTFINSCWLENHACENPNEKWEIAYEGECEGPKPPCPEVCTMIYDPVCGRNKYGEYQTFSNPCFFSGHACRNPNEKWKIVYDGEC